MNLKNEIALAHERIKPFIRKTILEHSISLSKKTKCNVYLKCENLQHTGSFKVRGAINKLLSLSPTERHQGIVAASTGNHGAAVAFGADKLKIPGIIFVPENASKTKLENIQNYGLPVKKHGDDCMITEVFARQYALENNMNYLSPYNDLQVIAGQGTIGIELKEQLSDIDAIFVPVGGGGLIAGISGYLKETGSNTQVFGCLPENSPVMSKSIQAGQILEMNTTPTLSDATAGGIEPNAITFPLCQKYVDNYILVSEKEIENAIMLMLKTQRLLIEGAAAVALAAFIKNYQDFQDKNIVVLLSGANISTETLKAVLSHYENH